LLTVLPYANVPGCQVPAGAGSGQLNDSTNSELSHEFFELATDPDKNAWFYTPEGAAGEIADLCNQDWHNITLNAHFYFIQSEYDNTTHNCTMKAPGGTTNPPAATVVN